MSAMRQELDGAGEDGRPGNARLAMQSLLYGYGGDRARKTRARLGLAIAGFALIYSIIAGRLVLSPHAAFYSPESVRELRLKAAGIVRDALSGKGARHCVNREQLSSFGSGAKA